MERLAACFALALIGISGLSASAAFGEPVPGRSTSAGAPDPREVSEENFRRLLSGDRPLSSCLRVAYLGGTVPEVAEPHISVHPTGMIPGYVTLVDHGYLERRTHPHGNRETLLVVPREKDPITHRLSANNPLAKPTHYNIGFCPGRMVIDELVYTEPADASGMKVVRGAIRWRIEDMPADFLALNASPSFDGHYVRPAQMSGESQFLFRLTNKGWQ
jgi:hypothetical protein